MSTLFGDEITPAAQVKSSEWYTPSVYIEAARKVMGSIDLDPASCAVANQTVKATQYYTKEQNGLSLPWYGNVWLNPPYGRTAKMQATRKSTIGLFIEKLLASYEQGKIEQAIVLATTEVNAKWFYPLWSYVLCFPNHRVHFIVPEKLDKYSQMFGTCFAYLGPNEDKFRETFNQFGHVVKAIDTPKSTTSQPTLWDEEATA